MPGTSPYSGNPNGGSLTSPAPGPGVAPTVNIQQDGYNITSLDTFQQSLETVADFAAYNTKVFDGSLTVKTLYLDGYGGRDGYTPAFGSLLEVDGSVYITGGMETGGITSTGSITATTTLTALTGDITADAGNIFASAGAVGGNGAVFDAAGGTAGIYVSGAVTVATTAGGTSAPTPTFHKGILYKDTCVLAWGIVNNNGSTAPIYYGVNIASVTRSGLGSLSITLNTGASAATKLGVIITCVGENRVGTFSQNTTTNFLVLTTNGQTAPSAGRVDCDFMFMVMGG